MIGIYAIVHTDSGRQYIGSAVNIEKRFWRHKCDLRKKRHHNHHLQAAWNKYGKTAFSFSLIKLVDNVDRLIQEEQECINSHPHSMLFNHCLVAGSFLGMKKSAESKQLMSDKMKGKPKSEEHKASLSIAAKGHVHTDEHKAKISAKLKGKPRAADTKAKISKALKGIKRTKGTKIKISKVSSNRSESTKKKLSVAAQNRSPETLLKMSIAKKGIPLSFEHKQKISIAMKRVRKNKKW